MTAKERPRHGGQKAAGRPRWHTVPLTTYGHCHRRSPPAGTAVRL